MIVRILREKARVMERRVGPAAQRGIAPGIFRLRADGGVATAALNAPEGYEDKRGFHFGPTPLDQ